MRPSRPTERIWFKLGAREGLPRQPRAAVVLRTKLLGPGGLEAALDPVGRLHAFGGIHLLGGITLDVDDGKLAALKLGLAVRRLHDGLMALADRHAHGAARPFESRALQRRRDLLV